MLDEQVKAKLDARWARFRELETRLQDPAVGSDPRIADYLREHGTLAKDMASYGRYLEIAAQFAEYSATADNPGEDQEIREFAREQVAALRGELQEFSERIVEQVSGADADDSRNVILEIRAGTGGDEAALFAGDLFRMYRSYADQRGWKLEIMQAQASERGGFKEIIVGLQGENVFRDMKQEGGGHRVQRVPETENQGRIHTSAATVAVLPEAEDYDIEIRPDDLKIDIQASSGPGGQSVNTTNSSVRITHLPTGIVVFMQEEKSQHKNKAKAMRVLRSRLYEQKKREEEEKRSAARRGQTGSGDRSERVRTYNFPQDRCTDHRLGRNFSLGDIIEGKLDRLIEALVEYGRQRELEAGEK